MSAVLVAALAFLANSFRSRVSMQLEILALRHQLAVYQRSDRRVKIKPDGRAVQAVAVGRVVEIPEVGGLHHHYERRAA